MKREDLKWGWVLPVLLLAGLASGCMQRAYYRPSSEAKTSYEGYKAAFYRIVVDKQPMGTAKVFSKGGYKEATDGKEPVIDVRLRIRNTSDAPITLVLAKTDLVVDTDEQSMLLKQAAAAASRVAPVPPGGVGNIVLNYPLTPDLKPKDINSFEFSWALDTGKGVYTQTTPFVRIRYQNVYYYYPGWYWGYPWYPDGWGWWGGVPYWDGDDYDWD